jgi:hypothetical protein
MSENTTNPTPAAETAPETQGQPAAPAKAKKPFRKPTAADKASKGVFATVEEARAIKPDNPNYRIYTVRCPGGLLSTVGKHLTTAPSSTSPPRTATLRLGSTSQAQTRRRSWQG